MSEQNPYKPGTILISLVIICTIAFAIYKIMSPTPVAHNNTDKSSMLVVGISPDYPPFEYMNNGEMVGFDIDLAKLIVEKLHMQLQMKDMEFASLIPALQSGRIDFIISAMTATPERIKNVDFTNPYYHAAFDLVMLKTADQQLVKALNNMKIGVQLGTSIEEYAKGRQREIPSMEVLSLTFIPQLIEEVKLGHINGVIVDREIAQAIVAKNDILTSVALDDLPGAGNVVVLPKNSTWTEKFNIAIEELKADGSIDMLKKKWLTRGMP